MAHEKLHKKLILSEVILIVGSVFIFRSLWHILDTFPVMDELPVLFITFVFGFLIAIPAWQYAFDKHH